MLLYKEDANISRDSLEFIKHLQECRFNLPAMEQAIDQIGTIELNQNSIEELFYSRVVLKSNYHDSAHLFFMIKWSEKEQREFVEEQIRRNMKYFNKYYYFFSSLDPSEEGGFEDIKKINEAMKMLHFWRRFVSTKLETK